MAATPRKFQEKIALINERAAQGTAAYEEIMQQVSSLRNQPRIATQQQKRVSTHQQTQPLPSRTAHSGSLPDFSINLSQNRSPGYCYQYPQQGAVSDLINLKQIYSGGVSAIGENMSMPGLVASRQNVSLQNSTVHTTVSHRHSHLSPPDMLLRSSSDSSLHHTAFQNKISPYRKGGFVNDDRDRHLQLCNTSYEVHKASGDAFQTSDTIMYNHIGRSSNIPIPTSVGIPCGAGPGAGPGGGGSLPDLTQVQFRPTPIPIPDIDAIVNNQSNMSGISSSVPPATYARANGPYTVRSPSSRGTSPGPSPRPSPNIDRKQKTKPYSQPLSLGGQRISSSNKACLSVPSNINIKAHLHMSKGIVTNYSTTPSAEVPIPNSSGLNIYGRPFSPLGSYPASPIPMPLMDYRNPVASPQSSPCASPVPCLIAHQTGQMTQYRCSSPDSRGSAPPSPVSLQHSSSPASSPGISMAKPFIYEAFAQSHTANQLNHQFQQITVGDQLPYSLTRYVHNYGGSQSKQSSPSSDQLEHTLDGSCSPYYSSSASPSPGNGHSPTLPSFSQNLSSPIMSHQPSSTSPSPILSHHHHSPSSPIFTNPPSPSFSQPMPSSPSHIPASPSHTSSPSHSPVSPGGEAITPLSQQPATPQTPQTPNVPLPRLVVTDQDGNDEQNLLNEVSEISSFLFDDSDAIFQNLSSLGEDELMSVDQILVDNEIEESFRQDLRNPATQQDLTIMQLNDFQDQYFSPHNSQQIMQSMQSSMDCQTMTHSAQHSSDMSNRTSIESTPHLRLQDTSYQQSLTQQQQMQNHQHLQQQQQLQQQEMQSLQQTLANSADDLTTLESLTSCIGSTAAETEALLSQIHQQRISNSPLSTSEIIVANQLDLGVHLVNNPSNVCWQQISQTNPQL